MTSISNAIDRWHLRRSGDTYIGQCPFCQKPGYKHSRPFVLFPKGNYFCNSCNIKGHVNGDAPIYRPSPLPSGPRRPQAILPDPLLWANHPKAVSYFGERGLTAETVSRFHLGYDSWRYTIPCWRASDGKLMGIKRRRDDGNYADHGPKYTSYKGSMAWIFNEVALEADVVVVCEGEIDVLGLVQIGIHAICSTAGVGHFPDEWISKLVNKKVILWFDSDEPGRNGAFQLAHRLEAQKIEVKIITSWPYKDINEGLVASE